MVTFDEFFFDVTIIDKLDKENIVSEVLSKLTSNVEENIIDDSFIDEHLFTINITTPWYVDIFNYLVVGKVLVYF